LLPSLACWLAWALSFASAAPSTVLIPPGKYKPFFKELRDPEASKFTPNVTDKETKDVDVPAFFLDKLPVTNQQFNDFLISNPQYLKSRIASVFAEPRYLQSWKGDLLSESELQAIGANPVTEVSWFVARKYCQSQAKRLPTIAEWEYAADASNAAVLEQLLQWYAKTGDQPLASVGRQKANRFGLQDMHGLIWEWVEDFNSVMIASDSRSKGDRTEGLYCGGGSINAKDAREYATFMRYGFRSGLRADYCIQTLGFRCASDPPKEKTK
jgi:sulfatase modifying factor 1